MPTADALTTLWQRSAIVFLVVVVTGVLSLLVTATDNGVAQLYVAAGFGLAFVLGWGLQMVWAVGLGSAAVSYLFSVWIQPQPLNNDVLLFTLASGVGAGLQAWMAWRWVQGPAKGLHPPALPLDSVRQVAQFLLIAGPLSCVVNAGLSTATMLALKTVPPAQGLATFGSWWAGDTLGVLIGAPMLLPLIGRPKRLWQQRRWVVGLPMLLASVLLGLGIHQVQAWENQREAAEFRQHAQATANAVRLRLNGYLWALEAVRSVYDASSSVDRQEFRRASSHWLRQFGGIQGMGWYERLPTDQLTAFEAQQQAGGLEGYRVFDAPGRTPPKGNQVVAMRFIEPIRGNERALGLNLLSHPVARPAYQRSVREDVPIATPGFRLTQETDKQLGVVIYRAVYLAADSQTQMTPTQRQASNIGGVFMTLRMDDALASVLKGMPNFMRACMMDATEPGTQWLGGAQACQLDQAAPSRHQIDVPLSFAGRAWLLRLWAAEPMPTVGAQATSWLFAVGGVAFAAALGAMLLVVTGTTEHMAAAVDEAREQRAAAESANQAKSEFLSRMSHELRTPLNAMLGFAQVMGIDSLNPLNTTQRNRVEQIQQAGWHLLDMIDDVLDLSRIDSGTLNLNTQCLPVPQALEAALALVSDLAKRQQVSLLTQNDVPTHWGIQADDTRLRQVLTNLLSNAAKYNRPGGQVRMHATLLQPRGAEPMVQVAVHDTGLGMSSAQISQLFQPFNRLGRERLTPDGTGIGLVISRHLAQSMGGELNVDSQEGQGSTFTLLLPAASLVPPAAPAQPQPGNKDQATAPPMASGKPTVLQVLYVEDNAANTALVRDALLSRPQVRLSVAETIEIGLATVHDRVRGPLPDLILLDVHLPDASGLEFLRLLKANPGTARIPVVMISADAMPEQVDACLKAGAACYLTKPLQINALLAQVDDLLRTQAG